MHQTLTKGTTILSYTHLLVCPSSYSVSLLLPRAVVVVFLPQDKSSSFFYFYNLLHPQHQLISPPLSLSDINPTHQLTNGDSATTVLFGSYANYTQSASSLFHFSGRRVKTIRGASGGEQVSDMLVNTFCSYICSINTWPDFLLRRGKPGAILFMMRWLLVVVVPTSSFARP